MDMNTPGPMLSTFSSIAAAGALLTLALFYRRRRAAAGKLPRDRSHVLTERFVRITDQLRDGQAAVQLAGVYSLGELADEWVENRQLCIDALCAYLRRPFRADASSETVGAETAEVRSDNEVCHVAIRLIAERLREDAAVSWQGADFDFNGVVFEGGDFSGAVFSGGTVNFSRAVFSGDTIRFNLVEFSGGIVRFDFARFSCGDVYFGGGVFSGAHVYFVDTEFTNCTIRLDYAEFSGGAVSFGKAKFSGSRVRFDGTDFTGGTVSFDQAVFSGAKVSFDQAIFAGGIVDFRGAKLSGATADFSDVADWSRPPMFEWDGTPPPGVHLPAASDAASA
jgi:hypothetical protein